MNFISSVFNIVWTVYVYGCVIFSTLVLIGMYLKYKETKSQISSQPKKFKQVSIEKIDGMWLMFDAETNNFLCQGKTISDLWKVAKLRFPDVELVTAKE